MPATIADTSSRDTYLCDKDVTASSNIPSDNKFTLTSGYSDIAAAVGISVKNQLIFNAITSDSGDANLQDTTFYSMMYNDNCMMHAWDNNYLSMTILSNCLAGDFASTTTTPDICRENWLYSSYLYGRSSNKPFCDDMATM